MLAAFVALAAGCGGSSASNEPSNDPEDYRGTLLTDKPAAPNLRLHDPSGKTVTLAGQRGRWAVVTFLYTYCPDVCPVIAGNLNAALQTAPARRAGLRVLAVSVDPERDTPAAARRYSRDHHLSAKFVWLLGTRAELQRAWRAFNVAVLPGKKRTVTHSTFEILIDPEGHERLLYDSKVQTADLVHDLNLLAPG